MSKKMYTIKEDGKPLRLSIPKHKMKNVFVPIGSPLLDIVIARSGAKGHKAPTVKRDLGLYYGLLKNTMAELWDIFGADEMSAILQVFQSQAVDYTNLWIWLRGGFARLVADEFHQTEACEQFEVQPEAILNKIDNLTELQTMALIDFTLVWWGTFNKPEQAKKMLQPFRGEG